MPGWTLDSHLPSQSTQVAALVSFVLILAGAGLLLGREGIAKAGSEAERPQSLAALRQGSNRTPSPDDQATPTPTNWIREMDVRGVAIDASQAMTTPIQGARVFVHMPSARCDPSTRTDASGRFARSCYDIHFFESWFEVHVIAEGFEPWTEATGVVNFELDLVARLQPHDAGGATPTPTPADDLRYIVVEGRVRREQDRVPIEAARIWATPSPGHCLSPVYSRPDGRFEMVCPRLNYIGTLGLLAEKPGFLDWTGQMRGSEAGIDPWEIDMELISMPPSATPPDPTVSPPPSPISATETPRPPILLLPDLRR